jgi:hypothetical protein
MLKRVSLLVLFFVVSSLSLVALAAPVFAQNTGAPAVDENNNGTVDNKYGFRYTTDEYAQYQEAVQNCDTPSLECLVRYTTRFAAMEWAQDIAQGGIGPDAAAQTDSGKGGVFAGVMRLTSYMYANPAANTGTYVADVLNTAGFVQPAYAQGIGFSSLDPILNLWKVFRNVAYFFFIIIFVVIGFMIMLRKRISGQAAVTAQQAIPSVIISLILVTFSYAIAGFMIDLMYVLMFLIIGLFNGISFTTFGNTITGDNIINFNILQLIGFFFRSNINAQALDLNTNLITSILESAVGTENLATYVTGVVGGLTLTLVLAVAVLIGAIRLFFELLKSYAAVILYVVAAPLLLMFGAFPGKDVFWPWLKGIIGNLIAFPAVLLMMIIYIEFTGRSGGSGNVVVSGASAGGFMPPFLMGNGTAGNLMGPLLGLAIILGLPDIVKEIKKAAGAGDGGIGSMLAGFAWNGVKSGVRNTPLVTAAVGAPTGAVFNVAKAAWNGERSPWAYLQAAGQGLTGGANTGFRLGKNFSRNAEQVIENKWLDPNSWENALLNLQKRTGGVGGSGGHGGSGGSGGSSGSSGTGTPGGTAGPTPD